MSYDVSYVNNTIVRQAMNSGLYITPLQQQKLLYILQVVYKKVCQQELIKEQFEAWPYGPVVPKVYYAYKNRGRKSDAPIKEFMLDENGEALMIDLEQDLDAKKALDMVWPVFSKLSGPELVAITHTPGSAWSKAEEAGRRELDQSDIQEDYELLIEPRISVAAV